MLGRTARVSLTPVRLFFTPSAAIPVAHLGSVNAVVHFNQDSPFLQQPFRYVVTRFL
jgi:hypothetical protein